MSLLDAFILIAALGAALGYAGAKLHIANLWLDRVIGPENGRKK